MILQQAFGPKKDNEISGRSGLKTFQELKVAILKYLD